jgi:hypothetical protein
VGNVQIILLNGTSSSGKSSLAKALQVVLDRPFLHIDGDYFWQVFPDGYFDDKPDEIYRPWRDQFLPACYRKEVLENGRQFTKFHQAKEQPLPG